MSFFNEPENPIVASLERTGYPDGKEPEYPHCPVCDEECDTIYKNKDGDIVGCDNCVNTVDAWEVDDCFPGKE